MTRTEIKIWCISVGCLAVFVNTEGSFKMFGIGEDMEILGGSEVSWKNVQLTLCYD